MKSFSVVMGNEQMKEFAKKVIIRPDFKKLAYGSNDDNQYIRSGVIGICKVKTLKEYHAAGVIKLEDGVWKITGHSQLEGYRNTKLLKKRNEEAESYLAKTDTGGDNATATPLRQQSLAGEEIQDARVSDIRDRPTLVAPEGEGHGGKDGSPV